MKIVSVRELLVGICMSDCNIHCFLLYFQSPRAHKQQGLSSPARDAEKRVCMALPFCLPIQLLTHAVESVHSEHSYTNVDEVWHRQ